MAKPPAQFYRAGTGAVIVRDGKVLALERLDHPGSFQFPQGGLDEGEAPEEAMWREVSEETGLPRERLRLLGRHPVILAYDLPPEWRSKRTGRGQAQTWFFLELDGPDSLIDLEEGGEFRSFRWVHMDEAVRETVPFRRPLYQALADELRKLTAD